MPCWADCLLGVAVAAAAATVAVVCGGSDCLVVGVFLRLVLSPPPLPPHLVRRLCLVQ